MLSGLSCMHMQSHSITSVLSHRIHQSSSQWWAINGQLVWDHVRSFQEVVWHVVWSLVSVFEVIKIITLFSACVKAPVKNWTLSSLSLCCVETFIVYCTDLAPLVCTPASQEKPLSVRKAWVGVGQPRFARATNYWRAWCSQCVTRGGRTSSKRTW